MGNERARQKKLAKHKKKRADAKRRTSAIQRGSEASGHEKLARIASSWSVDGAWLSADWDGTEDPALVSAVLVRRGAAGDLVAGIFLVDRTCLGIKSGSVRRVTRETLASVLDQIRDLHGGVVAVDLLTLQSVAFHAVDYARALGFSHDPDFPLEFLGARPEALLDTPFAKLEKPRYIAGPRDDVVGVMAQLNRARGAGNFDYVTDLAALLGPGVDFESAFEDAFEDADGEERDGEDEPAGLP